MTIPAVTLEWTPTLRELSNHLWQSTLFACLVALLALALRKHQARTRHWLWFAASLKFLVPFSLLIALGTHLPRPTRHAAPQATTYAAIDTIQPFAEAPTSLQLPPQPALPQRQTISLTTILLAFWITGIAAVLAYWLIHWRRISAIANAAEPLLEGREIAILRRLELAAGTSRRPLAILSTSVLPGQPESQSMEPGVFGLLRPVLLWPANISAHLDDQHLTAVLAHELTHVRRRDNLTSALHILTATLFWFHPLVWFIGRRLIHERERACDEHVLALHTVPHIYAESILKICELSLESPIPCVSGITGAGLRQRITHIVTHPTTLRLGPAAKLTLTATALATLAIPILLGQATATPQAPGWQAAAGNSLAFDVATVRENKSDAPAHVNFPLGPGNVYAKTGGLLSTTGVPLIDYIRFAYKLTDGQVQLLESQSPKWIASDRFDIQARSSNTNPTKDQMRLMMQSLLAERFHLKTHTETRELPILALVLARPGHLGPQLRPHPANDPTCSTLKPQSTESAPSASPSSRLPGRFPAICGGLTDAGTPSAPSHVRIGARDVPLSLLASNLSGFDRPIIDRTGLQGNYDFVFEWGPDPQPGSTDPARRTDPGTNVAEALQDQLGLKLQATKGPVETLVIDHIDRLSSNDAEFTEPLSPFQSHPTSPIASAWMRLVSLVQEKAPDAAPSANTVPDLQTTTGGKIQFDVASVKPNKTGPRGDPWHTSVSLDPEVLDSPTNGILSTTNTPLISLMAFAYKISRVQMMALQSSLPEWAFADGYNVEARADHNVTREQMRPMMQSLLEERFHIKVHYDMREVPVYAIVQVKPGTFGPHLQQHPPDAPCATEWPSSPEGEKPARPDGPGIYPFLCNRFTRMNPSQPDRRKEGGRNVSITTLGLLFFDFGDLDRPVIDGTGLKGNVDFVLEFSYELRPGADSQAPPPSGPSFPVALRDQLGLKLVPQKAPFPFLVVDHVERPTPQNEAQLIPPTQPHPVTSAPAHQPTLQRASFSPAQPPPATAKSELPAKPIAFDVVSIRPSNPNPNTDPRRSRPMGLRLIDDGLLGSNLSLLRFLLFEHPDFDFSSDRILGAPDWANTDTWDIQAKVADSDVPEWNKISHDNSPASMQRRRAALDAFLADRFKLKTHYETREGITYALVVAKGGSKLKPSAPDNPSSQSWKMRIIMRTGHREYAHASISSLTLLSTQELGHPVIDETGLQGKYDFTLDWASSSAPNSDNSGPDLTTALQDQLGLKLERRKGPIQYLVIDHVERPAAN